MQQGFVICTKAEGVTVTVADDATGAVLPLGDNGFGGITAELVDGFYRVETRKGNTIQGWYLAVTNGKVSDPIEMYSTVPDLCAFRPACKNFVAPDSNLCQACLDAIAFEEAQAESEGDEEEPDEYDDQHWRVGMDGYDDESKHTLDTPPQLWEVQVVLPAHLELLKRMSIKWFTTQDNPQGAPCVSLNRPYGNMDYEGDIAKAFGVDVDHTDYISYLHESMSRLLKIALEHVATGVQPGVYVSIFGYDWKRVAGLDTLRNWQARLEGLNATISNSSNDIATLTTYGPNEHIIPWSTAKPEPDTWSFSRGIKFTTSQYEALNGDSFVIAVAALHRAIIEQTYGVTPF